VSVDHRGSTIVSASMAAGDSLAVPLAVEQGASADSRKSSKASSDTAAEDDLEVVVPARTFTNSLYQPNLEAIEERRRSPRPGSLSSGLSGKSS
jgi:hypothetical protein